MPLNLFPTQTARRHKGTTGATNGDVIRVSQPLEVGVQDDIHIIWSPQPSGGRGGDHLADLRGANIEKQFRWQARRVFSQGVNETVLEYCLRNGDEDGAADGLEELDAGRGDGDPLEGHDVLDYQNPGLEADADPEAGEDLVAEPGAEGGGEGEGGDHARAGGEEDHAGEDEGVVVADDGDEAAGCDGGDDD